MRPLDGIRVLDMTRLLPGAFCTQILADFGADVVKIEEPGVGDYARQMPPIVKHEGAYFLLTNRNKRSASISLKHPAGREAFLALSDNADVLIESFRPGTMERLDLGHEFLRRRNARLIYCAISGYGQTGPYSNLAGHDLNFTATAGLLSMLSECDGVTTVPGVQVADIAGGSFQAVIGVLLAVLARQRTGQGQVVDVSMLDGCIALLAVPLAEYYATGASPVRGETLLTGRYACYRTYITRDRRQIAVAALEPKFWDSLCRHFEREDLIDRQFEEGGRQQEIIAWLSALFEQKTIEEWMLELGPLDACVSAVKNIAEMVTDPQVQHRRMAGRIVHPLEGELGQVGITPQLSMTPGAIHTPPPGLGEHTSSVLREVGYTDERIRQLCDEGSIAVAGFNDSE